MSGFGLLANFIDNPEALLKKKKHSASASSATPPTTEPLTPAPSASAPMAQKALREYSVLDVANVPTEPAVGTGDKNFELRTGLITMVQGSPFCGLPSEDANAHLQQFLQLCDTVVIKDVPADIIRLRLFPFSLVGKAKQWFYKDKAAVDTWGKCSKAFLAKFFPVGKTNACGQELPTSSRRNWNPYRRRGKGSRSTSWPVLTTAWMSGSCFTTSTMV